MSSVVQVKVVQRDKIGLEVYHCFIEECSLTLGR